MGKPVPEEVSRLRELVPLADAAWRSSAGELPVMVMPRATFGWRETEVYFANSGIVDGELYLEVRAFDGPRRATLDPQEIDWCIPMAYPGASEIERLGWKVGWGEGWSDSKAVLRLRFDNAWRDFFKRAIAQGKLLIATHGEKTASVLIQLERNRGDFEAFVR